MNRLAWIHNKWNCIGAALEGLSRFGSKQQGGREPLNTKFSELGQSLIDSLESLYSLESIDLDSILSQFLSLSLSLPLAEWPKLTDFV